MTCCKQQTKIVIAPNGSVRHVYSDGLAELDAALGVRLMRRASHVEPDSSGRWVADLSPVGGPQLGPFELRSDALSAELDWLESNHVPRVIA